MSQPTRTLPPLLYRLEAQYHARVWGGQHLKAVPEGQTPIGEAWVVYEGNTVAGGERGGQTVKDLTAALGDTLLGQGVSERFGGRFPLLIKLLDCADWLSVQVHPDDEQARALVGPTEFGKTEAWHFLEAGPGAKILAGVRDGTSPEQLAAAIRGGAVMDVAEEEPVRAGDTVFIPAGTLHALGPGLLLYEVQQTSDTTYRVYDWDRPKSDGRALHIGESVQVTRADLRSEVVPLPKLGSAEAATVAECPFFRLEVAEIGGGEVLEGDTHDLSLHSLTVQRGELEVLAGEAGAGGGLTGMERQVLGPLESLLVSAHAGAYRLRALGGDVRLLRASLPPVPERAD
jgi:mannose-6-phosphate isomerase